MGRKCNWTIIVMSFPTGKYHTGTDYTGARSMWWNEVNIQILKSVTGAFTSMQRLIVCLQVAVRLAHCYSVSIYSY